MFTTTYRVIAINTWRKNIGFRKRQLDYS